MLEDGIRTCDACDEIIPKGTKYVVFIVPHHQVRLFNALVKVATTLFEIEDDRDTHHLENRTFVEDSKGKVRFETCLRCKNHMGTPGEIVS